MGDRLKSWQVAILSLGGTMALGAVLLWAPWSGESLPAGVDLGDCDSSQAYTFTVSASLTETRPVSTPAAPQGAGGGGRTARPQIVLSTPVFAGPDDALQVGQDVSVVMRECDTLGVTFALKADGADVDAPESNPASGMVPSSLQVREQRLHVGAGSVYVSDPYRLPCEDGASCGAWEGWYFTMEAAGQGASVFRAPAQWGAVGTSSLDSQGQMEVRVQLAAAA